VLTEGTLTADETEDIKVQNIKVKELSEMIANKKVENAGTLIAYFICCTEI
jgi:hypothetical protein